MSLSLLTLNVARPTPARAEEVLAYLWHRPEEVLVLTEIGSGAGSALLARVCRAAGYQVVQSVPRGGPDRLGVLVVGRAGALQPAHGSRPEVLPHRILDLELSGDPGSPPWRVRLAAVYGVASDPVRYSSSVQRQRKREWLAAFDGWLPRWLAQVVTPVVLIGDLNIVDPDHPDELRYVLPQERQSYRAITAAGLIDAYRDRHPHGPQAQAASWRDHTGAGCRYDHAFVRGLQIRDCDLDQTPLESGLSDHAALSLVLGRHTDR